MSRWSYGDWAMAAVVIDDYGDVYPLSELTARTGLTLSGYYEEKGWLSSRYYELEDLTGSMGSRYEGHFEIIAHLRITDKNGVTKEFAESCEGYTCCGDDCFMLLIVTPAADASAVNVEFQTVDELEIKEAVGTDKFNTWATETNGESALINLDAPLF